MGEKLLTPGQVAERLQVTERTIYAWLRDGRLPGHRLGRLWRVHEEDLRVFLRAAKHGEIPVGTKGRAE